MPPSITGFYEVAINVADLERAERFYHDVLGMQVLMRIPGENVTMIVNLEKTRLLGLWLPSQQANAARRTPGKTHFTMGIELADVDAWYAHLQACGVEVRKRIKANGDAHLDFDDPDGNPLEFWARTGPLAPMPGAAIPPESRHLFTA